MIYIIYTEFNITIGKLIGFGVIIGDISWISNLYLQIYQDVGLKELSKIFLDNIPFSNVVIISLIFLSFGILYR